MNIYVGNLSFQAAEEDLRAAFGAFGAATVTVPAVFESGRRRSRPLDLAPYRPAALS